MLTPPDGLPDEALVRVLADRWDVAIAGVEYRPVGFGSHHWEAVDADGTRWFVTVDELDRNRQSVSEPDDAAFGRLHAALATAAVLRDAGATFVVAPIATRGGEPVVRTAGRFAVALYPYVDGQSYSWGDFSTPTHRHGVLDLIVALHTAPTREPHPGNTMLTSEGWVLIDWDTVLLAPPERDLWSLDPGDGSVIGAYADATGTTLRPSMLALYGVRWDLADIAVYVSRFRGPHSGSPDDEKSWDALCSLMGRLPT